MKLTKIALSLLLISLMASCSLTELQEPDLINNQIAPPNSDYNLEDGPGDVPDLPPSANFIFLPDSLIFLPSPN